MKLLAELFESVRSRRSSSPNRGHAVRLAPKFLATALLAASIGTVAGAASALPPCGLDAGPCGQPNGTPGCDEAECCAAVCAAFAFCCDVAWDADCVALRGLFPEVCENLPNPACGPGTGPCFAPNSTPGCENIECCEIICAFDPFCCDEFWDFVCATNASDLCPLWPCSVECPDGALLEPEACGELRDEGCHAPKPAFETLPFGATLCGTLWADGGVRDTDWFTIDVPPTAGRPTTELVITATAEPAVGLFLVDSHNCPHRQPMVLKSAFGGGCVPTAIHADLPPGQFEVVMTTAVPSGPIFDGFPCGTLNAYLLSVTLVGGPSDCVGDVNDDGFVDGADLGKLLNQWGTAGSADLNGDGVVDGADLGILLNDWGKCGG